MPTPEHFPAGISLPWWQVGVVLIGFPALYLGNYFMPWTKGLFKDRDRRHFFPFWGSIAFLHWASAGLVVLFVRQAGGQLSDVGFKMTASQFATMLGAFAIIGAVVVLLRKFAPANRASKFPKIMRLMLPATLGERVFWLFMCVTAGVCEELVYWGFGICALHGDGVPSWLAVILVGIAFVMIHGLWGVRRMFWQYFVIGALYSGVFLWVHGLTPGIWFHTLWDMMIVLGC